MEPTLLYFGKMILCSAVMFAYYLLFLKDKTFHHYNRFYLLSSVVVSLILPLVKVSYFTIETNKNLYLLLSGFSQNQSQTENYDITIYSVFYTIIGVVSIALLIRLILGILKINSIKKQFPNETIEGIKFYQTNLSNAPFSFFRNLFWKKSIEINSPVGQQILKHEMVHIEQKHSWDKLLMQISKSVFWFNPVFYFINKEINLIHEYLADKKAVKKSDTRAFAQMLLESHFSGSVIPVTSPFLSSNLKKRLKMLTKNQTKYSYARKLFALPILFLMVFAYMVNAKNKEITETNKAIEIAVEQIRKDTIRPKQLESGDSLHIGTKAIDMDSDKDHSIEKNADAIGGVSESPGFNKKIANAEKQAKIAELLVNSPQFRKKIANAEKQAKIAELMVNSPKFQRNLKNIENQAGKMQININSPEFQKIIQDAQKRAQDAVEKYGKTYTDEEFQKMIKDQYGKDAFVDGTVRYLKDDYAFPNIQSFKFDFDNDVFYNEAKTTLTPKELKKLEKKRKELREKQQELLEEQKKLQQKQLELNKEMRQSNPWSISFSLDSPKAFVYNKNIAPPQRISKSNQIIIFDKTADGNPQRVFKADAIKIINTSDTKGSFNPNKAKVYINGRLTDINEVDKIDPNMIASVNIFSSNDAGKIEIITK